MSALKLCVGWMLTLVIAVVNIGCGTIMGGTKQTIQASSTPPGATVSVERIGFSGTTPATFSVPRKGQCFVTFSKEGYQTQKVELKNSGPLIVFFILDILPIMSGASAGLGGSTALGAVIGGIGLVGLIYDAHTGGLSGFKQEHIEVALSKTSSDIIGPDHIRVGLLFEKNRRGEAKVRATSSLPVDITSDK